MNSRKSLRLTIISLICLIYVWLRFWHLTDSCLWFDEIFSVHAAEQPWNNLFWFVAQDLIHPPLFYVLLKIWMAIGGESLLWLRLFPVVFSVFAIGPLILLCRELKLSFVAIAVALLFLVTNGALIKYAQEVRMYSLLQFFSLVSIYLLVVSLRDTRKIWALSFVNVLLIYTHYFGWFIVFAELIAVLLCYRQHLKKFLVLCIRCLAAYVPWIYLIFQASRINADVGQNIGWMGRPDFSALVQFVFDLIEPFYYQATNIDWASNYLITIPLLALVAAAKIIFLINYQNYPENEKQNWQLLAVLISVPILIALIASLISPFSIWGTRHLIVVFAPVAILIGIFFEKIQNRVMQTSLLIVTIVLFSIALVIETRKPPQNYIWCAWENLAQQIPPEQPVKVYVFEDLVAYHFWFAERKNENVQTAKIDNLPGITEDKAYFLPRGFDRVKTKDFEAIGDERFYIAFRDINWSSDRAPLKTLIEKGYKIGEPKISEAQGAKAFLVQVQR